MGYRCTPRPHIVHVPRHTILLRFFQLFLATLVLILTAYGVSIMSKSGIILTLVTGRPIPPSWPAEDFKTTTHGNSSSTSDVPALVQAPSGAGQGLPGIQPHAGTPVVTVSTAPIVTVPTAPSVTPTYPLHVPRSDRKEEEERVQTPDIPFRDMDLQKLCPYPAHLAAPESVYTFPPSKPEGAVPAPAPRVPPPLSDWHEDLRGPSPSLAVKATRLAVRIAGVRDKLREGWDKTYQDFANGRLDAMAKQEGGMRTHVNPWGAPTRTQWNLVPATLMVGHLQTALASIVHLTFLILVTHVPFLAPFYSYPALLIVEALLLLLWFLSFAVLTTQLVVGRKVGYGTRCNEDGYCYTFTSWDKRTYFLRLMMAAAALAGLMFLTYFVSFIIFLSSAIKHRREGGRVKPLKEGEKHVDPFSFEERGSGDEGRGAASATDEEAGKHGSKSGIQKAREKEEAKSAKKAEKELKRAQREDEKALRHLRKGGLKGLPKSKPLTPRPAEHVLRDGLFRSEQRPAGGGLSDSEVEQRGKKEQEKKARKAKGEKSHSKLSLRGFERKQMAKANAGSQSRSGRAAPRLPRVRVDGGDDAGAESEGGVDAEVLSLEAGMVDAYTSRD